MDKQTGKLIARIAENLPDMPSDLMQNWIDNPRGLQKFLAGLYPPETASNFPTWKTIKLGTGPKTADDFRRALKAGGNRISDWANDILGKRAFTAADEETEVDLVVLSVAELGFKDGAARKDIYKQALKLGLELCPAEVGPQLRLQYNNQPKGEWLFIGMEPITDSGGFLVVFFVARGDDALWLDGHRGCPDGFWDGFARWVFVRPRK
jgi:hypothetical protein